MRNNYDLERSRMLYNCVIVSDSSVNNRGIVAILKDKGEQLCHCEGGQFQSVGMAGRNKDATNDTYSRPNHEGANSLAETADQRFGDWGRVWSNTGYGTPQSTTRNV